MDNLRLGIEWDLDNATLKAGMEAARKELAGTGKTAEDVADDVLDNLKKIPPVLNEQEGVLERLKKRYAELRQSAEKANSVQQLSQINRELQAYEKEITRVSRAGREGFDLSGRSMVEQEGILERLHRAATLYHKGMMEATRTDTLEKYSQKLTEVNAEISRMSKGFSSGSGSSGWNGLQNSINQISRELPAFAVSAHMGFLAISNNIPILADEIKRLKVQNDELIKSGQKGVPLWKQLASSLLSWQTAMSVGITLLVVYGKEIGNWVSSLFKGKNAVDELKESTKALNEAKLKGLQSAQSELTSLRALQTAATNTNLPMKERLKAVKEMQNQYPAYLKNVNKEAILAGKATDAYNRLTGAILANAQAKAYNDKITENASKQLENTEKLLELQVKLNEADANLQSAKSYSGGYYNTSFGTTVQRGSDIVQAATRTRDGIIKEIANIAEDNRKLEEQNKRFEQNVINLTLKNGLGTLTGDYGNGSGTVTAKELKKREELLAKILELDKEYSRKYMDSQAAEKLALSEKFVELRKLIEAFNSDPKNRIKINLAPLDEIESNALANLEFDQYSSWIRKEIEGLDTLEDKIESVNAQIQILKDIPADQVSPAQTNAIRNLEEYSETLNKERNTRDKKRLDDLLKQYATFEDKRKELVRKAEADIKELREKGKHAQVKVAQDQLAADTMTLFQSQIESSKAFKDIETSLDRLGPLLAVKAAKAGKQTVTSLIDSMDDASNEEKDELKKTFGTWFDDVIKGLENAELDHVLGLVSGFENLVNLATQFDGSMADSLKTISSMVGQVGNLMQNMGGAIGKTGGVVGGILGAVFSVMGAVQQATDAKTERYKQERKQENEFHIRQLDAVTKSLEFQLSLINEIYGAERIKEYQKLRIEAEQEINKTIESFAEDNYLKTDSSRSNAYVDLINQYGGDVGAMQARQDDLLKRYNKRKWNPFDAGKSKLLDEANFLRDAIAYSQQEIVEPYQFAFTSIQDLTRQNIIELNRMVEEGKFDEITEAKVRNILEQYDIWRDATNKLNEEVTGTSFESILNSTNALFFDSGGTAAEAWEKGFDQEMEKYLMSRFSREFLEESMQDWYDVFAEMAADGLTDEERKYLRDRRNDIKSAGDKYLEDLRDVTGIEQSTTEGGKSSSQVGRINRSIEEATASQILGFERARYDLSVKQVSLSESVLDFNRRVFDLNVESLRHQAATAQNTADTVTEVKLAVIELRAINKNTNSKTGRDTGYG